MQFLIESVQEKEKENWTSSVPSIICLSLVVPLNI